MFPITLVDGDVPSEGRLLVLINGTYGSVCDDFFGFEEAQVTCRQLNYSRAVRAAYFGEFGSGVDPEPIYFDNVICTGNESYLYECSYTTNHNCRHFEDVGVVCDSKYACTYCKATKLLQYKHLRFTKLALKTYIRFEKSVKAIKILYQGALVAYYLHVVSI